MLKFEGLVPLHQVRRTIFRQMSFDRVLSAKIDVLAAAATKRDMERSAERNERIRVANGSEPTNRSSQGNEDEDVDAFNAHRRVIRQRLFWKFSKNNDLFVCGPTLQPIPVLADILSHSEYISTKSFEVRWEYLEDETLSVDVAGIMNIYAAISSNMSSIHRIIGSANALNRVLERVNRSRAAYELLLPYQGFFVCIPSKADLAPDGVTAALFPDGESKFQLGRPPKANIAARAYRDRFPDGHLGYSLKMVREILRVEHGVSVGDDTMRKAIGMAKNADYTPE